MQTSEQRPTWSLTALARRSGLANSTVLTLFREGLVPTYKTDPSIPFGRKNSAAIPAAVAEPLAVALAAGVVTSRHARLMRENPAQLVEGLDALASVARMELEAREPQQPQAPAA